MKDIQFHKTISIPIGDITVEGELFIPSGSKSLVIFSHGSGSSRFSSRNNFVAKELQKDNIGTFLFDLLTKEEDEYYPNRFNIELLTERLVAVTNFILEQPLYSMFKVGFFGASTGAASALMASVVLRKKINAVVSRGGRPDLAMNCIPDVIAPTLLIVGELDEEVLILNQHAYKILRCEKRIETISGATHLFEEPGTLSEVATLAADWFSYHLESNKTDMIINSKH